MFRHCYFEGPGSPNNVSALQLWYLLSLRTILTMNIRNPEYGSFDLIGLRHGGPLYF